MRNGKYQTENSEYWYKEDVLHREDGPALIFGDGTVDWYLHGLKCSKELFDFIISENHHRNLK